MRGRPAHSLDAVHRRLREERVIEIELDDIDQLLEPDGRCESGVETLVGALGSARRLPETVAVRAIVTDASESEAAEVAFRAHCRDRAEIGWREALTIKHNGVRQLPLAVLIASLFGALAAGTGSLAEASWPSAVAVPLAVVGGISMIAAWASAWLPIEQWLFDWRAPAHLAATYDLLADGHIEFVAGAADRSGDSPQPAVISSAP